MSLQRQLTRGISLILAVIVVFMTLTSISYWDIEGFVAKILPVNITIARSYERLASNWNRLGDYTSEILHKTNVDKQLTINTIQEIDATLSRLENLVSKEYRSEQLKDIKILCASFTKQLSDYELLINNRNKLLRKNSELRLKAAQGLTSDVVNLLEQFKSMITDLNTTLNNPDFQASIGGASSLIQKISRIEKDLIIAETEIALYLSLRKEKVSDREFNSKTSATRVEERLRSILALLGRSISESETVLQKRVLSQVANKIRSFFDSFSKLRNILEAPESELLEIEDRTRKIHGELLALKQIGLDKSISEAEFFWSRIFFISDELKNKAVNNHRIIFIFLVLVLLAGIYFNIVVPRKIGGPLQELCNHISDYKLGNEATKPPISGTAEIDALGKSFQIMARRLNQQAEVNRKYMESIHSLNSIYRELHETQKRVDTPDERLEKAISMILQQLINQCPAIDLVKVMLLKTDTQNNIKNSKNTGPVSFFRIGEAEFSERFRQSEEFAVYCNSVGFSPDLSEQGKEELPVDGSLTGYWYENNSGIKSTADDVTFFHPVYSPVSIDQYPTLLNRMYEKGLNGCLIAEPLMVPCEDSDAMPLQRGLLFVYFLDRTIKISWQEIFFIQIIASQIATIIETDTLLQEHDIKKKMDDQLTMAREIQENLLPQKVPQIPGLSISKVSESAAEVGGDYYDFFELGNGRLGVVIADAAGKNVPAAIIMTVFKTTLSTMDLDRMNAGEVLTRANNIIARNITNDRFITATYVIIDSNNGKIELTSAGHNPAFVTSGRGMELVLHEKSVRGLPLGIMDNYNYDSISFSLNRGDLLFLYTDGVTEARNSDDEEFGECGLKRFLAKPRSKNPTQDLMNEIKLFSRHSLQHDDITAVSIEYNGS